MAELGGLCRLQAVYQVVGERGFPRRGRPVPRQVQELAATRSEGGRKEVFRFRTPQADQRPVVAADLAAQKLDRRRIPGVGGLTKTSADPQDRHRILADGAHAYRSIRGKDGRTKRALTRGVFAAASNRGFCSSG